MRSVLRHKFASRGPRWGWRSPQSGSMMAHPGPAPPDSGNSCPRQPKIDGSRSRFRGVPSTPGRVGCDKVACGFLERPASSLRKLARLGGIQHGVRRAFPRSCGGTTPMTSGVWRQRRHPSMGDHALRCRRPSAAAVVAGSRAAFGFGGRSPSTLPSILIAPPVDPEPRFSTVAQIAGCSVKEVESLSPKIAWVAPHRPSRRRRLRREGAAGQGGQCRAGPCTHPQGPADPRALRRGVSGRNSIC